MTELRARLTPDPTRPQLRLVADEATSRRVSTDTPTSGLRWARRYRDRLRFTDVAVILVTFCIAVGVRILAETAAGIHTPIQLVLVVPVLVATLWIAALALFRTRDPHVTSVGATEYKRVVNASALAFGLFAMVCVIWAIDFARGYFLIALPLGTLGLLIGRWSWRRWLLRQREAGHYLARAIVVGTREEIEYVVGQIDRKSGAAYHVVGAAIDGSNSSDIVTPSHRIPIVADLGGAAKSAAELRADTVIVAGRPADDGSYLRQLGWDLEGTATDLVLSSRLTDVAGPRIHFRPVEGLPLIHVEIPTFDGWRHSLKRAFDIVFAAVALIILAPMLGAIAIWVRADSPGPAFFRQERCGRGGKTFEMVKFRSMVRTAEDDLTGLLDSNEGAGVLFKLRNDPRVTRSGRWLRKYSLDELPQFWNILVGDMSVVGPRPPLQTEVERYEDVVHRRLFTKPGLTGLWQINGRSNLSWEESVRLDLYYVENWSLTGDFMIIWRTIKAILKPVGAY